MTIKKRKTAQTKGVKPTSKKTTKQAPRTIPASRKSRGRSTRSATPESAIVAGTVSARSTKQASILNLLGRPQGATIEDLTKATGWQPHSVRGVISGVFKKKLGLTITSEKVDGCRVYRVVAKT